MWFNFVKAVFIAVTLGGVTAITLATFFGADWRAWACGGLIGFALTLSFVDTPWEPYHPRPKI